MSVLRRIGIVSCLLLWCSGNVDAGDWPQWRYDAGRGAVSPDELPAELHLQWTRQLPEPRPAWPASQPWLRFDLSYSPVAAGNRLFVPSMVTDSVTAYDTETGEERWRFYADGPVRFAPIVHAGHVYFGSDDGHLYCVDAAEGRLAWRFRAGPSDRNVLGNQRLISTWPVRGGPVLLDGKVYFTAGIWPFMGIFVHAVDAESGESVWTNSGYAANWTVQPHNSPAFASLVPRGHLAATEHGLVVPGGRTEPGRFDLATGRFLGFDFGAKRAGSYHVTARRDWFFVTGTMRRIVDGQTLCQTRATVHDENVLYGIDHDEIFAQALDIEEYQTDEIDRKGNKVQVTKRRLKDLWRLSLPEAPGPLFLKAGSRFYAGTEGQVAAIEVDPEHNKSLSQDHLPSPRLRGEGSGVRGLRTGSEAEIVWRGALEGRPWAMLAADDKLFVVTGEGRVYCFGATEGAPKHHDVPGEDHGPESSGPGDEEPGPVPRSVLKDAGVQDGYCVLFGPGAAARAEFAADASDLYVIAVDPDVKQVDAGRRRLEKKGLYGTRTAVHTGRATTFPLPPYLASLILCLDLPVAGWDYDVDYVKAVFRALRPYGGKAILCTRHDRLAQLVEQAKLPGAKVNPYGPLSFLVRQGPLPGAADWTHQYADAANSIVSKDQGVKAPLGLLWFGGPPNDEVLPRHGHGPSPQVAGGRLFIEGRNMLRALDIYTGRLLWQKDLPDVGKFYDNTSHQPGANEIGSNYVSLADCVYVVCGETILKLDAATGQVQQEFKLEAGDGRDRPNWGFVAAHDDLLVATAEPIGISKRTALTKALGALAESQTKTDAPSPNPRDLMTPVRYSSTSRRVVVLNRHTGRPLWDREAAWGFRHNNLAVAADKLFCVDGLSQAQLKALGVNPQNYTPRLAALDVRTGREIWSTSENVFGTFLNYSEEHDVLLQAGSRFRDRADDECDTGMVAYRGRDGTVLWKKLERKHAGPCLLHHDTIITQGPAYSLLTGEPKIRRHALSGEPLEWKFTRNYGCNTAIASEHLITFRSAAAGYYDLALDGGTGNLGGFKSGCTSNLVVAGGLLNAPEYTRTCGCAYQNQTSLALVHDPDAEMWTFNALAWDGKPVRRVGINFGAPGDRRTADGTLWMDCPSVGGPSPDIPIEPEIEESECFRHHSSRVRVLPESGGLSWVAASGLQRAGRVILTLAKQGTSEPRSYTVRMHFAEPDGLKPGQRVFSVCLQGQEVLTDFDVAAETGPMTAVVKEFPGVEVTDRLEVSLVPKTAQASARPLLCGLEVVAEGSQSTCSGR